MTHRGPFQPRPFCDSVLKGMEVARNLEITLRNWPSKSFLLVLWGFCLGFFGEELVPPLTPLSLSTVTGNQSVRGGFCLLLPSLSTVFPPQFLTVFPPPLPVQFFSHPFLHALPEALPSWPREGLGAVLLRGYLNWSDPAQGSPGLTSQRPPLQLPTASTWAPAPRASTVIMIIHLFFSSCSMEQLPHTFCTLKERGSPFCKYFLPTQVRSLVLCSSCRPYCFFAALPFNAELKRFLCTSFLLDLKLRLYFRGSSRAASSVPPVATPWPKVPFALSVVVLRWNFPVRHRDVFRLLLLQEPKKGCCVGTGKP